MTSFSSGEESQSSDPFEEVARLLDKIASRLKPFATGRARPADYDEIKSSGLPRASLVFFLVSEPADAPPGVIPGHRTILQTVCDGTVGLHQVIAEAVRDGTIGPHRFLEDPLQAEVEIIPSFQQLALLYGYTGMVIRGIKQDLQPLVDDIARVWSQEMNKPADVFRGTAAHVAQHGPDSLDELSLDEPTVETMRRSVNRGVRVFLQGIHGKEVTIYTSDPRRTAPSEEIAEAEDLLAEIGVFWLLGFRWRWCAYRRDPHWYMAGHQEQYGCVRHRKAVQQDRYRNREEKRPRGGR